MPGDFKPEYKTRVLFLTYVEVAPDFHHSSNITRCLHLFTQKEAIDADTSFSGMQWHHLPGKTISLS